jgi:uncharacterized membrane-anchored protein YitT (DUF2179 family)
MVKFFSLFLVIFFFSVGNLIFVVPNTIMNGGITGLSQMGYYLYDFNIGISLFLLNLPLFALALLFFPNLFFNSVFSMLAVSLVLGMLQEPLLQFGIHNIWIGSIIGGLWTGISLGILARMNASLGGGSLLGKILHEKYGFSLSRSILLIDSSVYPLSFLFIGEIETLFSLILSFSCAIGIYIISRIVIPKKLSNLSRQV